MEVNRNNLLTHVYLAAALASLGRPEDARVAARDALVLSPQLTIARAQATFDLLYRHPPQSREGERFIEGLRIAGIPEG
jgi:hypothetical protein